MVSDIGSLRNEMTGRVLPRLKDVAELNKRVELAVTEYVRRGDQSITGKFRDTAEAVELLEGEKGNYSQEDIIGRREGFNPVLSDTLSKRLADADDYVVDRYLPFNHRVFVIGPMIVDEEVFKGSQGPTFDEDTRASTFFAGKAVAVNGKVLLELLEGPYIIGKITNGQLIEMVKSLIE